MFLGDYLKWVGAHTIQANNEFTELENEFFKMQKDPPEQMLYHYTTTAGLKGIIEDKAFWLTHQNYVNDTTEGKYGNELIRKWLKDRINSDLAMETIAYIEEVEKQFLIQSFVCCFCEQGDLLSQWRGYTEGSGYALGLSYPLLKKIPKEHSQMSKTMIRLGKVIYEKDAQEKLIEQIFFIVVDITLR